MIKKFLVSIVVLFACLHSSLAQVGQVEGVVYIEGQKAEFAQVFVDSLQKGTRTSADGLFHLENIPYGDYQITATYLGYTPVRKKISISPTNQVVQVTMNLTESKFELGEIVVTGTKTFKRKTNSPVIVNVLSSKTIKNVQACNLSEGLKFQPGLRVETDCQTCNYTQLRMNGLAGGYSQILINGRPIFSPLTGLYGMEQLPANMIDKIEVVRGAGSSLYGSSAIGGTVNVLTKIPKENQYELEYAHSSIDGKSQDGVLNANATLVSDNKNSGVTFFLNHRDRDFYDANGDDFSEIPLIKNTSVGASMFFLPKENQKLEFSVSHIHEYRLGGEMVAEKPAYLAKQSEERTHDVWMASGDYQVNFNQDNSSWITYLAWQNTDRKHYTGIQPDHGSSAYQIFIENPPYGTSDVQTFNVGSQLNHRLNDFLGGRNVMTLGMEYVYDKVLDEIPAYSYLIDQKTRNFGAFLQSDWAILPDLTLLSGIRLDKHNLVDKMILSPRASLLYKLKNSTQFRLSYGRGFRAPQAFDTDLHIAFAGGGVSRVFLPSTLQQERSNSLSASVNYDKVHDDWIAGFTAEAFYTRLKDAFFLQPVGSDQFGELFEKQNGDGAKVKGVTLEVRANYNQQVQLEGGFTVQSSEFDTPVQYIDDLAGTKKFTRTPNDYGYAILTLFPNHHWNATVNYLYTGQMLVPHFAGAPNQTEDEIINSRRFSELSAKLSHAFDVEKLGSRFEIYAGVKNIFNAYQNDFDIGKNRDSNFIYGPAQPRTFYVGIKLKSAPSNRAL